VADSPAGTVAGVTDPAAEAALADALPPGADPRPDQVACVSDLLAGARVVCVQATGWGKSTVYFAATRALRQRGGGPVVVVTPLLALMRDQVPAAERAGLRAASINSANRDDWGQLWAAIGSDAVDIVFVSPERLAAHDPDGRTARLCASASLLVVDEAHCISDWGHDFRPDYRRLAGVIAGSDAVVLATTATANQRVTADIARQLGADTVTYRGGLARASLRLAVVANLDTAGQYAWCADAVAAWRKQGRTGIVYVPVIADTTRVADWLASRGLAVAPYSGALDADQRQTVEDDLRAGRLDAVVATSALGMGYDHPSIGFVVHLGSPASPVAYYQQIGRAGRAIDDADIVLLPGSGDERLWEYFATAAIPRPDDATAVVDALASGARSAVAIEAATGVRRGRVELLLKTLAVDGAAERDSDGWYATGVPWVYDHDHYDAVLADRRAEIDVMRRYTTSGRCLMRTLQEALDDPSAGDCGRCGVCAGESGPAARRPDGDAVAVARAWLQQRPTQLAMRKRWPAGGRRRGAIAAAAEGWALTVAGDDVWAGDHSAWRAGRVTDGLVAAAAHLTADKIGQVDRVVAVGGPHTTVAVFAARLAERLAVPHSQHLHIDAAVDIDADGGSGETSASQVARLDGKLVASATSGRVLVVADTWRSGWTATVAAAELADAGATSTYVIAVTSRP
jgi:ATP-dependent DNA helicase RecQ